jgi:rhodanese-related sulfurtransferase
VKFLSENLLWISLAAGSGIMLLWPMLRRGAGGVANVTPNEAVMLINRSNAVVLDVREDAEFANGHIADARHIPLAQLAERIKEIQRFKDKPILVNCQAGTRAAKACDILRANQFTQVKNLQGGLNAWVQTKLPVVKS